MLPAKIAASLAASLTAAALLVLLTIAPAPARAVDRGFYVGGSLGESGTNLSASDFGFDLSGHDTAFKVIGGFRLLKVVGFEVNYVNLGAPSSDVDGTRVKIKTTGVDGFVVGYLPIPVVDVYGKIGTVSWDSRVSAHDFGLIAKGSGTDLAYGAGVQMNAGGFGGRLEYERFNIFGADKVDLISVGFIWNFL